MPTGWELPTPTLPNEGYPLPSHLHFGLTKSPKLTMDRFPHHDVLKEHTLYFYISLQPSLSESLYKTLVVGIATVRSRSNLRARLSLLDDVADSVGVTEDDSQRCAPLLCLRSLKESMISLIVFSQTTRKKKIKKALTRTLTNPRHPRRLRATQTKRDPRN